MSPIYISPMCNVESDSLLCGNNKIRNSIFFSLLRLKIGKLANVVVHDSGNWAEKWKTSCVSPGLFSKCWELCGLFP